MRRGPEISAWVERAAGWVKANKALLVLALLVGLIAWVPLYGILFPPLVDLPEHILISKLLWEKLRGISHLDLEISWLLGYRLFPAFMMLLIPLCKLLGISFVYLPRIVAMTLMAFHVLAIVALLYFPLKDRSWKSGLLAACLSLPAIVCMYSACWFIGFVNYTLAITLLVPAVFLTERFLRFGQKRDALWLFLNLLLVYAAHPFALAFWLMWYVSRALAAVATRTLSLEWKRLVSLVLVFAPLFLYHFLATRNTSLAPSGKPLLTQPAIVSLSDWYQNRLRPFFDGALLKPDDAADSRMFARFAAVLILLAAVLAFRAIQYPWLKKAILSGVFLIFISSWVNEKAVPVPGGSWLAYDYRFSSTVLAIGLALSGMVLIHLIPAATDRLRYKIFYIALAILSVWISIGHLVEVRKAYKRYDRQARRYMAKVFKHETPVGISLPHSRWHPDGTLIKLYTCLEQPDCNPPGTTFFTGYVKELYPVKLKSAAKVLSRRELAAWRALVPAGPLVGYWKLDEPGQGQNCDDASGNGNTGKPKGTTVVDGKSGKARGLNGVGDYIEIPAINIANAITVSAWVFSDKFSQNGFVLTKNPVNTQWALFFESDGYLKWRGSGVEQTVKCPAPSNGAWHHIVAKQEGTNASLYIDGVLSASGPVPPIGNGAGSITMGRFDGGKNYYLRGRIDEVRVYNRALTDSEISELFRTGGSDLPPQVSSSPPG
jgi:hypothetical protein